MDSFEDVIACWPGKGKYRNIIVIEMYHANQCLQFFWCWFNLVVLVFQ